MQKPMILVQIVSRRHHNFVWPKPRQQLLDRLQHRVIAYLCRLAFFQIRYGVMKLVAEPLLGLQEVQQLSGEGCVFVFLAIVVLAAVHDLDEDLCTL